MEEGTSYGTPAWRVRKKLLARLRTDEPWLVLAVEDVDEQQLLIRQNPSAFFVTDHYEGYAMVLARLEAVDPRDLETIFEAAWRRAASKSQLATLEQERRGSSRGRKGKRA